MTRLSIPCPARRAPAPFSVLAAALALGACAAPGSAPPASPAAPPDLGGSTFVLHYGGLDSWLSDPRDAGLRRALELGDERLQEVLEDLGRPAPPPGSFEFLHAALVFPWTLRVGLDGSGPVPVRATLVVRPGDAERAAALAQRATDLVQLFGLPQMSADDHPGLTEVETPGGSLFHGTVEDGRAFLLAWGQPDARAYAGAGELPDGADASLTMGLDLEPLLALVRANLPPEDPEAEEVRRLLEFTGLEPGVPVRVTFAAGHDGTHALSHRRYGNWARLSAKSGALAEGPIAPATIALVPGDATLVSLVRFEPTMLLRLLELYGPKARAARDEVERALGLALGPDLLEPLGATFGVYLSDSTGGGGLASAVGVAAVDDEARLTATLETLMGELRELVQATIEGRVRVRAFEHGDVGGYQLDFPGLPVPLSPSLALARGHLFVAATPAALAAALDAAAAPSGGRGGWRAAVAAARLGGLDGLQSLLYADVPRWARAGYGTSSLLGTALANAVRSPADPAREPGAAWPAHAELLDGAQPLVSLARVEDADLVTRTASDRSVALHVAAALGFLPEMAPGLLMLGALATQLESGATEEQEMAAADKARADVWSILSALDGWALENDGLYPDSLESLLEPSGEDGLAWLLTLPPDPWGNPYVYELDEDGVRVLSYGADGMPGGEGEAADITSDELQESWDDEEGGEWELEEMEELDAPEAGG